MKPKHLAFIATISLAFPLSARAADVNKANNTTNLDQPGSWVGLTPGTGDYAVWDSTITAANPVNMGSAITWGGIKITSPYGPVTINGSDALTLSGAAGSPAISMSTATQNLTINSDVVLGASQSFVVNAGIVLDVNGIVSGSGMKITKATSGTGTLNLTNASNSYTGGTTLSSAGTVSFVNGSLGTTGVIGLQGGRLVWAPGNTQDISGRMTLFATNRAAFVDTNGNDVTFASVITGAISDPSHGGLTKLGAGTLTLNNANTYTGSTVVQGGTLKLDYSAVDNVFPDGSALVLKGATLELAGSPASPEVVAQTLIYSDNAGYGGRANKIRRSSGSAVLQMGDISRAADTATPKDFGATVDFATENIATTTTSNTYGIIAAWATVAETNWASAGVNGSIVALKSAGYTNDTWALGINTDVTLAGSDPGSGAFTNSLRFNAAGAKTLTLTDANQIDSGGILVTANVGANATIITGGSLSGGIWNGEATKDLVIHQNNPQGDLTISSAITGANALTKNGAGKLILTTQATHTQGTYINAGVLNLQGSNVMLNSAGGGVYIAQGAAMELENAGINVTNKAMRIAGTGINHGGAIRNIVGNNILGSIVAVYDDSRINSDSGTLTFNQTVANGAGWNTTLYVGGAGNVTMTHNISGGLNLVKDGSGVLSLNSSGTNGTNSNYTGQTQVNAGTLLINAISTATTNTPITVGGNGTLGGTGTMARSIVISGKIEPGAPTVVGTLTTTGNVDFSTTGQYACTLNGSTSDMLAAGTMTVASGAKITFSGTPSDPSYVIATYSGPAPTPFATDATLPAGYSLDYTTVGQIKLVTGGVVTPPYDTWALSNGLTGGAAGGDMDPDFDGLANDIEFVVGGQPNPANPGWNSNDLLPTLDASGANAMVFTFGRTDLSMTQPGIAIVVQYGSDLAGWTDVAIPVTTPGAPVNGATITITDNGAGTNIDEIKVSIPKAVAPTTSLFARLKVSL